MAIYGNGNVRETYISANETRLPDISIDYLLIGTILYQRKYSTQKRGREYFIVEQVIDNFLP